MIHKGLSIDGGGVLGVGPIELLKQLEEDYHFNIYDEFDFFSGTSVGAVIVILLSCGYTIKEIRDFFHNNLDRIFSAPFSWKINPFKPKYSKYWLKKLGYEVLQDTKIKDIKKPVYITSTNLSNYTTKVYDFTDPEERLLDIIEKSMSAPTYFLPVNETYVDGGIWCNNPSLVGVLGYKRQFKVSLSDIKCLSLGTNGEMIKEGMINGSNNWSLVQWVLPLVNFLVEGNEKSTDFFMSQLDLKDYLRLEPNIYNSKFSKFDDPGIKDDYALLWKTFYGLNIDKLRKFFDFS